MNGPTQELSIWTRGRFLGFVGVLFVLQAGLIFVFGVRESKPIAAPLPSTHIRAIGGPMSQEQLRRLFFCSDPAVFPLPGPNGFSGRAWMRRSPAQFQSTNQVESPLWLALDAARLGTGTIAPNDAEEGTPLNLALLQVQQFEPPPLFRPPETVPVQPVVRVEGELAQRLIGPPPALHDWPSPGVKLLTNTVVQIAVGDTGDVLAARLMTRCGSADADADALAKAWELRFRPAVDGQTVWAKAFFQWQTTFPTAAGPHP